MSSDSSTTWLSGCIPDLPTPFNAAGEVDLTAFAGLCARQIKAGVSAILVGETTGEFSTLTSAELDAIIRTAASTARGRVRVIAGAGSNSTSEAVERARCAELAGADAILSVVPYYNKPMQAGIDAHFRAVANSTALPVVLHDIPARTIRELADNTLLKLSESPQFIGLMDSTGDLLRPARLRPMLPGRFRLLSGDDATAFAFLASGGDGCISIASNIAPFMCRGIFSSYRKGRMQSAQQLQQRLLPLASLTAKENPAAVKYALSLFGLMRADTRLPLAGLSDQAKAAVADAIAAIGKDGLDQESSFKEYATVA
ncbi:MAG: 4-hydroxy-tetrahydrodipicolinate synthase [Bradyrhizobium sp.]